MEYRRDESFMGQPSSTRPRDPYENMDRPIRLIRRSVSPQELPQDVSARQRNGGSVERMEYGWVVGRAERASRVRSRSPPAMLLSNSRKRPQYDNGVGNSPGNYSPTQLVELRQRHGEIGELKNLKFDNDDAESHDVNAFGYDPSDPRSCKGDFDDVGFSAGDKRQFDSQDSVLAQGSYQLPSHRSRNSASIYGVSGGKMPLFSRGMDSQKNFEQGRVQYNEVMDSHRLPVTHSYVDGQKPVFQTREFAHQVMPGSKPEGLLNPSDMSRNEYLAYQDGVHYPQKNEFKGSGKLSQPMNSGAYSERSILDSGRAPEGSQRSMSFYPEEYSPDINKGEDEDYYYLRRREVVDDRGYPGDDMHEIDVAPRDQLNYGRTQIIYDDGDISRPTRTHAFVDRNDNIDGSGGNLRRGIKYYRPATEDQIDPDYINMRRQSHASKQGGDYLGPRYTQVHIAEDHKLMHIGASKNHQISYVEEDYVSEDDLDRQFQQERLRRSQVSKYRMEMNRHNLRVLNLRNEHGMYKPQDRVVKGKYRIQEGTSSYNPRKSFPGKMYSGRQFEELHETEEEWADEEMSDVDTSRTRGFQQPRFRRTTERNYDGGLEGREAFVSDEWLSSQEVSQARKLSVGPGFNKPYNRHIRGNRRVGYTTRHNSQQFDGDRKDQLYRQRNGYDRRNQMLGQNNYHDRNNHVNNRQQKIWNRNEGRCDNRFGGCGNNNDGGPSEDWVGPEESVLAEDSEEFKQLVHNAFLKFSRMLNGSLAVQRRYKEEGKAGSLICVVCGRSVSKEFMDTRRLVTHAFMSHKTGLRADHLGLLKAICVMLGWSNVIPTDTITWVPQILPQDQALAQKEDLILWPPVVVIHNISLSDKNPEKWKVITVEALETFIRGKGLIRGRVKVVLGKPADQSVMVVKFLGTFSGLGDAEKIHKYFAENNRGRLDLESKIASEISVNNEAETVEENILYGYIGISEDLGRVDFSTRNTGSIKSKIDILDLANAPVKAEETRQ